MIRSFQYLIHIFIITFVEANPLLDIHSISSVLCCENICLGDIGQREASLARDNFQAMNRQEQKQWILDYLISHSCITEAGRYDYTFVIGISTVCANAWRLVLGLRRSRYYYAKKLVESKYL